MASRPRRSTIKTRDKAADMLGLSRQEERMLQRAMYDSLRQKQQHTPISTTTPAPSQSHSVSDSMTTRRSARSRLQSYPQKSLERVRRRCGLRYSPMRRLPLREMLKTLEDRKTQLDPARRLLRLPIAPRRRPAAAAAIGKEAPKRGRKRRQPTVNTAIDEGHSSPITRHKLSASTTAASIPSTSASPRFGSKSSTAAALVVDTATSQPTPKKRGPGRPPDSARLRPVPTQAAEGAKTRSRLRLRSSREPLHRQQRARRHHLQSGSSTAATTVASARVARPASLAARSSWLLNSSTSSKPSPQPLTVATASPPKTYPASTPSSAAVPSSPVKKQPSLVLPRCFHAVTEASKAAQQASKALVASAAHRQNQQQQGTGTKKEGLVPPELWLDPRGKPVSTSDFLSFLLCMESAAEPLEPRLRWLQLPGSRRRQRLFRVLPLGSGPGGKRRQKQQQSQPAPHGDDEDKQRPVHTRLSIVSGQQQQRCLTLVHTSYRPPLVDPPSTEMRSSPVSSLCGSIGQQEGTSKQQYAPSITPSSCITQAAIDDDSLTPNGDSEVSPVRDLVGIRSPRVACEASRSTHTMTTRTRQLH